MKRLATAVLMCLFFLGGALSARAEGTAAVGDRREQIQALILMRLNQNLSLNATQSAQVGQILRKYQQRRHTLKHEMKGLNQQLRAASTSGNDAEIQKLLSASSKTRAEFDQIDDQMFNDLRPLLRPKQQAQFLIEMDEIRSEIRNVKRRSGPGWNVPPAAFSNNPNYFPPGVPASNP